MPVLVNIISEAFEMVGVAHKLLEAIQELFNTEFFDNLRKY